MIEIAIPGAGTLRLTTAIVDFNGTLARDGRLKDGVAERLKLLASRITVCVVTGDTTGTVRESLAGFPLTVEIVPAEHQAKAKRKFASRFDINAVVAIGNGRNDRELVSDAGLSICIIGDEGCSAETLLSADVVCADIRDALDLLLIPRRLVATLRR